MNFYEILFAKNRAKAETKLVEKNIIQNGAYSAADDGADGYSKVVVDVQTVRYGWHVDPSESDPSDCISYLADAIGATPAAMGASTFSYGSWAGAFFLPKPCMLKSDGTVAYYLDPNDYSKKADGTASDAANPDFDGNAMMEFPKIWYKFEAGTADGEGSFYVSNKQVDDSYKCWCNLDADGNEVDHFYIAIYNGTSAVTYDNTATYAVGDRVTYSGAEYVCITDIETAEAWDSSHWEQAYAITRLRSLSGVQTNLANGNGNTSGKEETARAAANDTTAKSEWYIDTWSQRVLINALLVLISKSLDTQGCFGQGISSGSQAGKEAYITGLLDDKGLFYGNITGTTTAVKVFGIENWWGLAWHRTTGLIGAANNEYRYKLTYSTVDGTAAAGYNSDGTGYLSATGKPTASNYIKLMSYGKWGFIPFEVGAYSSQYYKDYYYNGTGFALVGGASYYGAAAGAFYVALDSAFSVRGWAIAASLSCIPCKKG